jgi:hypothetical protein
MALRGANIEVIDLGNRTVIPGLNDSQMHPIGGGLNYNMELAGTATSLTDAAHAEGARSAFRQNGCQSSAVRPVPVRRATVPTQFFKMIYPPSAYVFTLSY